MHRLALMSHVYAFLEHNIDRVSTGSAGVPSRVSSAIDLIVKCLKMLENGNDADPQIQELHKTLGTSHITVLALYGVDPNEILTSIAESWAILRSPDYQSSAGKIQRWMLRTDDQNSEIPYGNN